LLGPGKQTPAPWINVIANPEFGFQVAAEGGGYTWSQNSREHALTPWSNDPVSDRGGEAFYIQDDDTGDLWGPTAAPTADAGAFFTVRHGQGYSRFLHESRGIALDLLMFVPLADALKISRLRLHNLSRRTRHLSISVYVEWVLGVRREASAPSIVTESDPVTGALFARNPCSAVYGGRVAFADLGGRQTDWTADRREFLGRHGSLDQPAALQRGPPWSRRVGAGLDPCAALLTQIELPAGATIDVDFFLGECADAAGARALIQRYRGADLGAVFDAVTDHWDRLLGTVQVRTPDRSMDLMMNRWMLYQTLACRLWARSAFYQASGAYGFRDQLQDTMALCTARPDLAREHLLRAAGRQFIEGDVQHWWLPATGQGVRTRISDDRVWLAYVAAHYVAATGDVRVLDEPVGYLDGQVLRPEEQEAFFQPSTADQSATLFEHCALALDRSLAVGIHGLPLIGAGDWNDGMNRVGPAGKGESVWLGWFLHAALQAFLPLAERRGDRLRLLRWRDCAASLAKSLDEQGWDGGWYRRGFYDDGATLGAAADLECRIDSIAQSWSVLSGAGAAPRPARAMTAVLRELVEPAERLALLFAPPFDHSPADPGYVKGYPPGIRENGGQYTHAAAWCVIALTRLGEADEAAAVFALLNPINHSAQPEARERYKVEPYVVAADIYSVAPHVGRGGWTWYTGSAAWLYRAGLEAILGFRVQGDRLIMAPVIPAHWPGFEIRFRHGTAVYEIRVRQSHAAANPPQSQAAVRSIEVDGERLAAGDSQIALRDDGRVHEVHVHLERDRAGDAAA
jgi:cyclic beta-1,2-glucan synthetase